MQKAQDIHQQVTRNIEELRGRKDPAAVKAVAKEMEAMFAYEMIKVMRETSGKAAKGSLGGETYMSMFDLEISKLFAERGLGLQQFFEQGIKSAAEKTGSTQTTVTDPSAGEESRSTETDGTAPLPVHEHARISSGFGVRQDPMTGKPAFHHGLDIAAPAGTDIHAVRSGTVVFSGEKTGYGNVVIIDHGDGFKSTYAHNQVNSVQQGQHVEVGSVIAQVGSTGRSTGPHVHLEVSHNGNPVSPTMLLSQA